MAQLNNLIVTGDTRLLNTAHANIDGTSENVTGVVEIEHGGTGATTRLGAAQALTDQAVASPGYVVGLTSSWATFGYTTLAQLKTAMALNNVGNFKAVSTSANQGLSDTEKSNARTNIGAGTVSSITINATSPIQVDSSSAITTSGTRTLSHATSGATAGSYGDSSDQSPAFEGSFKVPYITVNGTGHVTSISEHDVTLPAETTYSLSQSPNYLNNLIFSKTSSAGGGAVTESLYIPTIVRGTMVNDSSSATAFVVSAPSAVNILYDGLTFIIKNTKVASAANCTININNLGAKRIWCSQSNGYCTTHWGLNQTYLFVYDSTNDRFELQQGRDTDSTDTYTVRPYYTHPKASGNGIKQYSLFARLQGTASASTESVTMDLDLYSSFTSNNGTGTKTYTNNIFDITKLYYYTGSGNVASGSTIGDNTFSYQNTSVDLRYTLNITTSTLTANKPIYLVFMAIDAGNPIYGQIANTVESSFPVYTQDIGAVLTLAHGSSTLEAFIPRLRFVYVGIPRNGYLVDLLIDNPAYMANPHVSDTNKWRTLVVPTRNALVYTASRANNDSDGNRFQDTYMKQDRWTSIAQDSSDGHKLIITTGIDTPTASATTGSTITIPDNNTTYSMSRDGSSVKLTPSSGSAQTVSLSDLITGLSVGTSNSNKDDYLITQYVGGGSSNNNYYRRKLANIVNEAVVKNALSNFIYTVGSTGTIKGGTTASGYYTNNGTYIYFNIPISKMIDPAVTTITFNRCCGNIRFYNGYYFPNSYQTNGYDFVNEWSGAGFAILRDRCVGTNILIRIDSSKYTGVPKASGTNGLVSLVIESDITVTFS